MVSNANIFRYEAARERRTYNVEFQSTVISYAAMSGDTKNTLIKIMYGIRYGNVPLKFTKRLEIIYK